MGRNIAAPIEGAISNPLQPGSITLSGNLTVTRESYNGNILAIDPGGAARDVTLYAVTAADNGLVLEIVNMADAAETITVKNAAGDTLETVEQNRAIKLVALSGAWVSFYKFTIALT